MKHNPTILILVLAFFTPGTDQAAEHRFEIRDEAGVPTAVTTGGPRFEGELFDYELVLTLEQDPGNMESLIATAQAFAMTRNGLYVVVDNKQARGGPSVARLVVFGPDGKFLRSMGQVGEGPGDFRSMLLEAVRGDTVEVFDGQLRRVTRYRTDGEFLEVITSPPVFAQPYRLFFKTAGGRYLFLHIQDTNIEVAFVELWITDSGGSETAHQRTPEVKNSIMMDVGMGRPTPYQYPYPPIPSVCYMHDNGLALSGGVEPVLDIYGFDGELKRRIRVEDLPLDITREDIDRFDACWNDRIEGVPEAARPDARRQRNTLREAMPASRPPWTYMAVDDRDYWWLRIQNDPDVWMSGDRSYSYRLLSPEGEYLGDTEAPPTRIRNMTIHSTFPVSVSNGHFLTMETDPETGGQLLNVYRMVPAARGFRYR